MAYNVHVAYGFHVNLYHSYRGDTPDEKGFGSDIRVIRGILRTLDALNAEGIPAKGTWDFENFFSLEQILPAHAPDIIEGVKRRVKQNGDENIIMGYSNGALGAMDDKELAASVKLAVSNPAGSGLRDIFGACEMIVRPQEMMFTPAQTPVYSRLGVKALCLYYSSVPFDGFKTLVPPLPDRLAFSPLTYEFGGSEITVLPTYSNADVCDAGCLRAWVKELHQKQLTGEIDRDVLLFINMDADAVFWESLRLPPAGSRIANTDGINGLVREIADLKYVVFDTPGGFLRTHGPAGKLRFTQDTADGNFTGYASWAEKPYNRKIWTAIEQARLAERAFPDENAFMDRVKLLSTTHFGLATPVLNVAREQAADALAAKLTKAAFRPQGPLTAHAAGALACGALKCLAGGGALSRLRLRAPGLEAYAAAPMDETCSAAFLMLRFSSPGRRVPITAEAETEACPPRLPPVKVLHCGGAALTLSATHGVESLTVNGKKLGGSDFLSSWLTYRGKRYGFKITDCRPAPIVNGEGAVLTGEVRLPGATAQGRFRYTFFTTPLTPGFFVIADVSYPVTPERDAISTENSTLGRYTDFGWQEAAPFCLRPLLSGSTQVIKRSYNGTLTRYATADFGAADEKNRTLASFNNHLTAGMVGVTDGQAGLLLGISRAALNSMAACPMRLGADGGVLLNPFGTFFGPQRHHPNRSGDRIPNTYTLIAPQGKSLAPAYNGCRERAVMCLLPFTGPQPPQEELQALLAFADGAYFTGSAGPLAAAPVENVTVRAAQKAGDRVKMRSPLLTGIKGNVGRYAVRGARALAYILRRQKQAHKTCD